MSKVWFITGSSRGLGRALTEAALEAGHKVVATARRPEQLVDLTEAHGDLRALKLDVTLPAEAQRAVATATETFGRIDVLVNNAGYGFVGAFEKMTADEFRGQINTNFWGVVNVTRAALPHLREQGSGHIIQVTSAGGRLGFWDKKLGILGAAGSCVLDNAKTSRAPWESKDWCTCMEPRGPDSDAESLASFAEYVGQHSKTREDIKSWFDALDLDNCVSFGGES